MIGLGAVRGTEEWLPGQVRRDIGLLDGARAGPPDADAAEVALEPALPRRRPRRARARRGRLPGRGDGARGRRPGPGRGRGRGAGERRAARGRRRCARGRATRARESAGLEVVVADDGAGFRSRPGRSAPVRPGALGPRPDGRRGRVRGGRVGAGARHGRAAAVAGMTARTVHRTALRSGPSWRSPCCATCAWPGR